MSVGIISGDRYALKWVPGEGFDLLAHFKKGVKLSSVLENNSVTTYYCETCRKMIIDLDETNA